MYQVVEQIIGGEYERRDGHKPHYSLTIRALGADDHEDGLPRDDISQSSVGPIGLTIVDGIAEKTVAHWGFYSRYPQHYLDYESSEMFDSYESAKIFANRREAAVIEVLGIKFDEIIAIAVNPESPFKR